MNSTPETPFHAPFQLPKLPSVQTSNTRFLLSVSECYINGINIVCILLMSDFFIVIFRDFPHFVCSLLGLISLLYSVAVNILIHVF